MPIQPEDQLFPERQNKAPKFSHRQSSKDCIENGNTLNVYKAIEEHGIFHQSKENSGLRNSFAAVKASPEQTHDMLGVGIQRSVRSDSQ